MLSLTFVRHKSIGALSRLCEETIFSLLLCRLAICMCFRLLWCFGGAHRQNCHIVTLF